MYYYFDISEDAVKIDLYTTTEFVIADPIEYEINFDLGDYSFTSVGYDAATCGYLQNNEQ